MENHAHHNHGGKRLLIIIGALLLATVFVYCRPWKNKSPEERAEWITKRIAKELALTDTQKQSLDKIKDEILARHKAEKAQRDAQFQELTALVRGDSLDKAKLTDLKKRHQAMREGAENLFMEKVIEFHKVLTPEQRGKAADAMQKHMKHFSGEK